MKKQYASQSGSYTTPQTVQPAGWYDENLEVSLAFRVSNWSGEPHKFNSLYYDNRDRFFLVNNTSWKLSDWTDLPATAFREVSFEDACRWVIEIDGLWADSDGDLTPLVRHALKARGTGYWRTSLVSLLQSN